MTSIHSSPEYLNSQKSKNVASPQLPGSKLESEQPLLPPHSIEAEQSVLGGLMISHEAWDKIVNRVSAIDFYQPEHRLLFETMTGIINRKSPVDFLTVTEALKANDHLKRVGTEEYLIQLSKNIPSAANIMAYADIVRERSILRQLLSVSSEISSNVFHSKNRSSQELLEDAESRIFKIAEQCAREGGPVQICDLLTNVVDKIEDLFHSQEPVTGVSTGFIDLDRMTSGLQGGDLIIIAGRPSMGKTTFCMNIAENVAIGVKKPVLVFSLEMPGDSLAMRMMSSLGHIEQHKVRTGRLKPEDWPRLTSAVGMLSEAKLFIDDTPALSPAEVRARARRFVKEEGELGLIVLDYLQLMQVPGKNENRTAEISEISRSLKTIAKELNVPFIALSQLNRSLEQRHDKRPVMSDLRESGSIEQDADIVVFIYRDEVYNENTPDKGMAEIIIAKHRNGPIGKVRLKFRGEYTRFENAMAEPAAIPMHVHKRTTTDAAAITEI